MLIYWALCGVSNRTWGAQPHFCTCTARRCLIIGIIKRVNVAHPAAFPEAVSQRAHHRWLQSFSLVSLGLFSLFPGEISSLDGKCCAGCVIAKLIQNIVEYNLWLFCFHKCGLFWFKWLLNHSHACFPFCFVHLFTFSISLLLHARPFVSFTDCSVSNPTRPTPPLAPPYPRS